MTLSSRQPCRAWRTLNERVDFRDFSHLQPNSRGPSGSSQTNNARVGSITVCRSSRSRLLTSNFIPCEAATSTLKSGHLLTRLRERWFLPDRQAARYPTFLISDGSRIDPESRARTKPLARRTLRVYKSHTSVES